MDTPICDFVKEYAQSNSLRLHMPGHKGKELLGIEHLDITEIKGADSLYEASDVIAKSEENASKIFGCKTFYSTEGSSQCIRAMLYLVSLYAKKQDKKPLIAAGRNAHKAFLTAVAMLDVDVCWLYQEKAESYLSCELTPDDIEEYLKNATEKPVAVYLTSPDYLGIILDLRAIKEVCAKHDVLLIVDNAHGAYLKFLPNSLHPIDLGADMCCSSAHKTLPVLTGGAYLHLSKKLNALFGNQAKTALALFGSTSPSYLILQSLDNANKYLEGYSAQLKEFVLQVDALKKRLKKCGFVLHGNEPLKLTVYAKPYGYTGEQLAELLRSRQIEPEFADPDYLVMMLSCELDNNALLRIEEAFCQILPKTPIPKQAPCFKKAKKVLDIREAMLACTEVLPIEQCAGRILAMPSVACPPAVPILVCGEQIDEHVIECFKYYGSTHCVVCVNKT